MTNFEEFVEAFGPNWRRAFQRENFAEGKRDTLNRQLRLRFDLSELPPEIARRIEAADLDALIAAEARILFVERPEHVFPAE